MGKGDDEDKDGELGFKWEDKKFQLGVWGASILTNRL